MGFGKNKLRRLNAAFGWTRSGPLARERGHVARRDGNVRIAKMEILATQFGRASWKQPMLAWACVGPHPRSTVEFASSNLKRAAPLKSKFRPMVVGKPSIFEVRASVVRLRYGPF